MNKQELLEWEDERKSCLEAFAKEILNHEELSSWRMDWETIDDFGMCCRQLKFFTIPVRVINTDLWKGKEYILHEIAHAIGIDELETIHDAGFYKIYADLLIKYMNK